MSPVEYAKTPLMASVTAQEGLRGSGVGVPSLQAIFEGLDLDGSNGLSLSEVHRALSEGLGINISRDVTKSLFDRGTSSCFVES